MTAGQSASGQFKLKRTALNKVHSMISYSAGFEINYYYYYWQENCLTKLNE